MSGHYVYKIRLVDEHVHDKVFVTGDLPDIDISLLVINLGFDTVNSIFPKWNAIAPVSVNPANGTSCANVMVPLIFI
jgi:hypothetical protein